MRVEIISDGRVLRNVHHNGQLFVEAPKKGKYSIRLHNDSPRQRMAVVSVDGVNVINGEDAGFEGSGYVMRPWETLEIPGWRRDDKKVAGFEFRKNGGATYAEQTGRGTSNNGIIGVAVFDEKVVRTVIQPPVVIKEEHHHHHYGGLLRSMSFEPLPIYGATVTCDTSDGEPDGLNHVYSANAVMDSAPVETTTSASLSINTPGGATKSSTRSRRITKGAEPVVDVGTGYGKEQTFHTMDVTFNRATEKPAQVIEVRYATTERLKSWGVPIDHPTPTPTSASAFPASQPSVPAPPGYRG